MKKLFFIYIVIVHLILIFVIAKTDITSRVQRKLGFDVKTQELTKNYYHLLAFHKRVDQNIPANSVIFIGDSLTQGLAVSAISPQAVNFGIGYDTSLGIINRLPYYTSIQQAKLVVIAIGFNDLKRRSNEELISNYKQIIDMIPPNIPILFSAILPVNELPKKLTNFNRRIRGINQKLKRICSTNSRLYFLDIAPFVTNSDNNLDNKYHIGDGIHPNKLGNAIWISKLREKIESIGE